MAVVPQDRVLDVARTKLLPYCGPEAEHLEMRLFGVHSGFFFAPVVLAYEWGWTSEADLMALAGDLALGHLHYAFQDQAIDSATVSWLGSLVAEPALLMYLRGLAEWSAVPLTDVIEVHLRWYQRYSAAIRREKALTANGCMDAADVLAASDKSAPIATVIETLGRAAGRTATETASAIAALLDVCAGLQLLDDLHDIVQDISDGLLSLPVHHLLAETRWTADDLRRVALGPAGASRVKAALAKSGIQQAVMEDAAAYMNRARDTASSAGNQTLAELADRRLEELMGRGVTLHAQGTYEVP